MERRMGNISSLVLKCTLAAASWDAIVIWDWSFSFSFLAPFFFFFTLLCKDSAMLLCQSMYNHTTNYGDMFIWEMAAIPTVHVSRLLTRFSHPWFANSGKQVVCWKNSVNATTWYLLPWIINLLSDVLYYQLNSSAFQMYLQVSFGMHLISSFARPCLDWG